MQSTTMPYIQKTKIVILYRNILPQSLIFNLYSFILNLAQRKGTVKTLKNQKSLEQVVCLFQALL